jgi:Flp pilus assembly protein TadB
VKSLASSRDLLVAGAFAMTGGFFAVQAGQLTLYADGVPGPGFFPLVWSVLTLLFAAVLAAKPVLSARRRQPDPARRRAAEPAQAGQTADRRSADTGALADGGRVDGGRVDGGRNAVIGTEPADAGRIGVGRALAAWGVAVLSVALLSAAGFVTAMVLLTALLLLGVEQDRRLSAICVALLLPPACHVLFALLLQVRLPQGPFGF